MVRVSMETSPAAQGGRNELVIGLQNDMTTLDYFNPETNTVWNAYQVGYGFEGLFSNDPDYNVFPVLACSLRGIREHREDVVVWIVAEEPFETVPDLIRVPNRVCFRVEVIEGRHVVLQSDDQLSPPTLGRGGCRQEHESCSEQDKDEHGRAESRRAQKL